jgi:clan AA aspartic protease
MAKAMLTFGATEPRGLPIRPGHGEVMNRIKLTNYVDHVASRAGRVAPEAVRSVELEALVDTGAMELAIPAEVARTLGLESAGTLVGRLADGSLVELGRVHGILLEILGREMNCSALVLPEGTTALIGQIPLEALDLIVDPARREARVNPSSPDVPIVDLLAV